MSSEWLNPPHTLPAGSILPSAWCPPGCKLKQSVNVGLNIIRDPVLVCCGRIQRVDYIDASTQAQHRLTCAAVAEQWEEAAHRVRDALSQLEADNDPLDTSVFLRTFVKEGNAVEFDIGSRFFTNGWNHFSRGVRPAKFSKPLFPDADDDWFDQVLQEACSNSSDSSPFKTAATMFASLHTTDSWLPTDTLDEHLFGDHFRDELFSCAAACTSGEGSSVTVDSQQANPDQGTCAREKLGGDEPVKSSSAECKNFVQAVSQKFDVRSVPLGVQHVRQTMPDDAAGLLPHERFVKDPSNKWTYGMHRAFSAEQLDRFKDMLRSRRDGSFAYSMHDLPGYTGIDGPFEVEIPDDKGYIAGKRYKSVAESQVLNDKAGELRDIGFISLSSPTCKWASETTCPAKKDSNGEWTDRRLCMDYREINKLTTTDHYGTHLPEDLFRKIGACAGSNKMFSKLDLRAGYHQIPVLAKDREKLSFRWGTQIWHYNRMPFGAKNACAKFQRVMDREIQAHNLGHCAEAFIDDVIIHSDSPEQHIKDVEAVLLMLERVGLRAHPDKSVFGAEVVEYIGHYVGPYGLQPAEAKIAAIKQLKAPTDKEKLLQVLGFCNYYRCYLPNFSTVARPLTRLLSKNAVWQWGKEENDAFEALKAGLCEEGRVLRNMDLNKPTILYTDWSGDGVGAVLAQKDDDGNEYMVACVSRSLNVHERNYSSYEGEMLGAVWGIKTLRSYLHGVPFTLVTDHRPLTFLMGNKDLAGKHARWALLLQDYDFTVVHRPGSAHANADLPSRQPRDDSTDVTGARLNEEAVKQPEDARVFVSALRDSNLCRYKVHSMLTASEGVVSAFIPSWDDIMGYNEVDVVDASEVLADFPVSLGQHQDVGKCDVWVDMASSGFKVNTGTVHHDLRVSMTNGKPDVVYSLNTHPQLPNFAKPQEPGVAIMELFGGICAGLEAALRAGLYVQKYVYCDIDEIARNVAYHRVRKLRDEFPGQFDVAAFGSMWEVGNDVAGVDFAEYFGRSENQHLQWLIVGGWECQDLSPAGGNRGINGPRSRTFYDLVRAVAGAQIALPNNPPNYIFENIPLHLNFRDESIRVEDYEAVCEIIGVPFTFDAAQTGSRAHRLRSFWTNLADVQHIKATFDKIERQPGLYVQDILDSGRVAQCNRLQHPPPFYQFVNEPVQGIMNALPTLVSYPASRAFRGYGKGLVFDRNKNVWEEPNPDERERALGYQTGATNVAGVTQAQRHSLTGRCMDANAMRTLLGVCLSIGRWLHKVGNRVQLVVAAVQKSTIPITENRVEHPIVQQLQSVPRLSSLLTMQLQPDVQVCAAISHIVAAAKELPVQPMVKCVTWSDPVVTSHREPTGEVINSQEESIKGAYDAWRDVLLLSFLKGEQDLGDLQYYTRKRLVRRAKDYEWQEGVLWRVMPGGRRCQVPPPEQREAIISQQHQDTGHFGVKRTLSMLRLSFYWSGMDQQVHEVLRTCEMCSKVKANFSVRPQQLHPLPIEGLFYRVGIDLFGELPECRGYKYVMVIIEYYSKHLELVPLTSKKASVTAEAFLTAYLSRFGAPAEVVTDQGTEFQGDFAMLLERAMIDHRTTSANHPQADGLAERAVQTAKKALRKYVDSVPNPDWVGYLPWILLGYRSSVQASSRMSPYYMLYGRHPVVPPAVHDRWQEPLGLGDDEQDKAAELVLQRAQVLQRNMVVAMENLQIAQHRDTLRYALVRSGSYTPRLRQFAVGDFVWVKDPNPSDTLQAGVKPEVLQVVEIGNKGTLTLRGKCNTKVKRHVTQCAPCHLLGIDPTINPELAVVSKYLPCEMCHFGDQEKFILLCDACGKGWHTFCVKLDGIPEGTWVCPVCDAVGVTVEKVTAERKRLGLEPG